MQESVGSVRERGQSAGPVLASSAVPARKMAPVLCPSSTCVRRLQLLGGLLPGRGSFLSQTHSLPSTLPPSCVVSAMAEQDVENELLDYEEDEEPQAPPESTPAPPKKDVKGSYVSIHSSGFRDFLLKPELLRAIVDCGFEHPSEGMPPGFSLPRTSSPPSLWPPQPPGQEPAQREHLVSGRSHVLSPSVQHECIPQAILGMDVLCQAKSGMGKTAVFVLATLQQIEPVNGQVGGCPPCWARAT